MASIRKRQAKYQVQVRLQGHKISKTFSNLKDAQKWSSYQNLTLWGNYLVSAIRCGCEIFLWDYFVLIKFIRQVHLKFLLILEK